jgi:hypothetical protein
LAPLDGDRVVESRACSPSIVTVGTFPKSVRPLMSFGETDLPRAHRLGDGVRAVLVRDAELCG